MKIRIPVRTQVVALEYEPVGGSAAGLFGIMVGLWTLLTVAFNL